MENPTVAVTVNTDVGISPLEAAEAANKLWLSATCQSDLEEVERLYRWALSSKTPPKCAGADADGGGGDRGTPCSDVEPLTKKAKSGHCGLSQEQFNRAGEKLALLLCQSGRCKKAKKGLASMGFTCRLAEQVLDYPLDHDHYLINEETITNNQKSSASPCQIIDGFISQLELKQLRLVFESPESSYWSDHNYSIDPPSPYFSYVIPLEQLSPSKQKAEKKIEFGFIGNIARKILACPILNNKFPQLQRSAKYVEIWAHNRPHASGHQMVSHINIMFRLLQFDQIVISVAKYCSILIPMMKVEEAFEIQSFLQFCTSALETLHQVDMVHMPVDQPL